MLHETGQDLLRSRVTRSHWPHQTVAAFMHLLLPVPLVRKDVRESHAASRPKLSIGNRQKVFSTKFMKHNGAFSASGWLHPGGRSFPITNSCVLKWTEAELSITQQLFFAYKNCWFGWLAGTHCYDAGKLDLEKFFRGCSLPTGAHQFGIPFRGLLQPGLRPTIMSREASNLLVDREKFPRWDLRKAGGTQLLPTCWASLGFTVIPSNLWIEQVVNDQLLTNTLYHHIPS